MTKEQRQPIPEETWVKISTSEVRLNIARGVVQTAISLRLTPGKASRLFANLDDNVADGIAYLFSGVADGQVVRDVGQALGKK